MTVMPIVKHEPKVSCYAYLYKNNNDHKTAMTIKQQPYCPLAPMVVYNSLNADSFN